MGTKRNGRGNGGVTITGGAVSTSGGDIFGGDKFEYASSSTNIDQVFTSITEAIERVSPDIRPSAADMLRALKDETSKGQGAKDSILAKLVNGLVGLVPSAVSAVVGAFAHPLLIGLAGPATKQILDRIQNK